MTQLLREIPSERPVHGLPGGLAAHIQPINWREFWADESPEQEWLIEPIIPAGRQIAMYSAPKQGKSLIALDGCAAAATGRSVFGSPAGEAFPVVYIDQEMTRGDLKERLEDLGYGPESDLSRLHYYQLVELPPLDTEQGGAAIETIVTRHAARLVVLDTMARVVAGGEDKSDTYRDFFSHSGMRLKNLGVALWRLDHAGKDVNQGQRGSSEKAGDVDAVYSLHQRDGTLTLKRTHSRIPWLATDITLTRHTNPLRHIVESLPVSKTVLEIIKALDQLDFSTEASANKAVAALKDAGQGRSKTDVLIAVKIRKARA